MEVVFGLLLVLLGECCGTETVCDARQNGALCYGVLGRSVYLQLINNASGVDFKLIKDPNGSATQVIKMRKNDLRLLKTFQNRTDFFKDNGTLLIKTVEKTDAAVYKFDASENGIFAVVVYFNFTIEAPVSSLDYSCKFSAHGELTVNCSSNGDSLHYSWTLDAKNLTEETNIITLKKGQSGRLSCSVKNHVSSDTVTKDISTCPGIVFVKCMFNGRMIEEWVNKDDNTLCDELPTVPHNSIVFVKCMSNGRMIEEWVNKDDNTLCDEPPTVPHNKTTCDGRQTGTLCYGILGESVYIHLTDDATEVDEYTLIKRVSGNPEVVQTLKSKEVKPAGSRFKFLINNGTLIIRGVTKNDSAEYKFNSFKDGKAITTLILHFKVKDFITGRYHWIIRVSAVAVPLVVVVVVGKLYLQKNRHRQPNSVAGGGLSLEH